MSLRNGSRRQSPPRPEDIVWHCANGPTVSNCGHAAIDWEVHACDEACFVRSEEQGGRRDLLRAAEPPERDGRGELGAGLVGPLFGRLCVPKTLSVLMTPRNHLS